VDAVRADIDKLGGQLRLEMRDAALDLQRNIFKQTWMIALTMFSAAVAAVFSAVGLH
jgi:hypothetical protein